MQQNNYTAFPRGSDRSTCNMYCLTPPKYKCTVSVYIIHLFPIIIILCNYISYYIYTHKTKPDKRWEVTQAKHTHVTKILVVSHEPLSPTVEKCRMTSYNFQFDQCMQKVQFSQTYYQHWGGRNTCGVLGASINM